MSTLPLQTFVPLCVSGEAPDDREHGHDAIKNSDTISHVETMAGCMSDVGQCQQCWEGGARLVRVEVGERPREGTADPSYQY